MTHFPEHDPDEHTTSDDLLDSSSASLVELIHPYPNLSSFLLGEWYWNDRLKKSQSSFANLLNIVGHLDYQPEDVWNVNWRTIDANLGGNPDVDDGWEDERAGDSDWTQTPIRIKVPFHSSTQARRSLRQENFTTAVLFL